MDSARTIRLLVVVDAVLVAILAVLAIVYVAGGRDGGNPGGGPDAASAGPVSTATAGASAPAASTEPAEFASPTGNIACTMSVDGVTCRIASYTYAPPVVPGCAEATGHVIVLDADGVAFECESGPPPAVAGDEVPVLAYGSTQSVGDYTCRSATDGVQCVDGSGTGFRLARASWTELPA